MVQEPGAYPLQPFEENPKYSKIALCEIVRFIAAGMGIVFNP
jgi:hypothetical protein